VFIKDSGFVFHNVSGLVHNFRVNETYDSVINRLQLASYPTGV